MVSGLLKKFKLAVRNIYLNNLCKDANSLNDYKHRKQICKFENALHVNCYF